MWLTVSLVAGAILTARLFLWPTPGRVSRADAVVVLSGDHGDRLARALVLMREGTAPTLVLDGEPDFAAVADLCDAQEPFEVVCLRPQPDSTRAEARIAGRLSADRRWRDVVVVTSRFHVTRAGLLFRRCTDARVTMEGTDPPFDRSVRLRAIGHEWLGLADATLRTRSC